MKPTPPPGQTVRKRRSVARTLGLAAAWLFGIPLALMLAQPSIVKRPVLEVGATLLVGFKPEIYAKEVTRKPR